MRCGWLSASACRIALLPSVEPSSVASVVLVSELVYYTISLSFVLPVLVGVLFTILHALIQTYVLTMLTANYYGEVSEPPKKKAKKEKKPAGAVPAVN